MPYIKNNTNNKIIIDLSHTSGLPYMIKSMSLASIVSGAVGAIKEGLKKEEALCDKEQALTIEELEDILNDIKRLKGVV